MAEEMENQDVYIAMYYGRLGNYEEMVAWMQKGFEDRDIDIHYAVAMPGLQDIFKDTRLKHIPEEVGLPSY
jgi:hypothetical protein